MIDWMEVFVVAFTFMEGNEAIAWGAIEAGCRFYAGYPITPATTIFNAMVIHGRP